MVTFPATTRDISEQLSSQHAPQKVKNTEALLQIMSCIPFLSRQGLAMRGDGDESDGNLQQLLCMTAADSPNLADWLKRKENVYTSPDIQMKSWKQLAYNCYEWLQWSSRGLLSDCDGRWNYRCLQQRASHPDHSPGNRRPAGAWRIAGFVQCAFHRCVGPNQCVTCCQIKWVPITMGKYCLWFNIVDLFCNTALSSAHRTCPIIALIHAASQRTGSVSWKDP